MGTIYSQDLAGGKDVWMFPGDYSAIGGAAFDFDFAGNPHLDPRITFTSTAGGAYTDVNLAAQTAGANTPRFDFDANTRRCKGLIIASAQSENAIISNLATIGGIGSAMTLYAECYCPTLGGAGTPGLVAFDDGTANNAIHLIVNDVGADQNAFQVVVGGVLQCSMISGTASGGQLLKMAASWSANSFRFACNGFDSPEDTSGSIPTVSRLVFGRDRNGNYLNNPLRCVRGWRRQMTTAELVALTA